ncbi:MAG: OmpA family protein [Nitrospirae bacterium]|nr:MAG: OmpA family protein [Nitrospirota bacterium]
MKRFLAVFALALFLMLPVLSSAEIREGSFEINPYAGYYKLHDTNRGGLGLGLGYNVTKNWGVQLATDYVKSRANLYRGDVLYHFMPEKAFNPFIMAGVGSAHKKPNNGTTYNRIMEEVGVGFKYFFNDYVGLRVDARGIMEKHSGFATTAGLVFALGGKVSKPQQVQKAAEPVTVVQKAEPKPEPRPEPKPGPRPAPRQEPMDYAQKPKYAAPVKVVLEDIHFDFDKATLTKEAKKILDDNARKIKENSGIGVQIEGHACAHGTEEHNAALSERRANAVKEYLVKSGIAADRLSTLSYGEKRLAMPEVPTPKNKNSKEAKANRRVHFEVIVK